jgi:hypothetical protein
MDWLGRIIDILGKPVVWAIGLAFLVEKIAGDKLGISITDNTILSIWNIVGTVCLAAMLVTTIIFLYNHFVTKFKSNRAKINQEEVKVSEKNKRITILNSLSDGQKAVLRRFCEVNQHILHDFEIGGYHAVWKPDMRVLIHKGIVEQINYSTFEIKGQYYDLIKEAQID